MVTTTRLTGRTGNGAARAHGADRGEVGVTVGPVRAAAGRAGQSSTTAGDTDLAARTRRQAGCKRKTVAEVEITNTFANG